MFVLFFEDFFFVFVTLQSVGFFIGIVSMDIRKGMIQVIIYIMVIMLFGMVYMIFYIDYIVNDSIYLKIDNF